jgi:hypothetical protein
LYAAAYFGNYLSFIQVSFGFGFGFGVRVRVKVRVRVAYSLIWDLGMVP